MNFIEKIFSVTPKKSKEYAGVFILVGAISGVVAGEIENDMAKVICTICSGVSGSLVTYFMSRTLKVSKVKNLSQSKKDALVNKIQSKKVVTNHDNAVLAELLDKDQHLGI